MNKIFSQRLRELRKDKNWRQSDLADRLHLANNTISSWERGNSAPSIDELDTLAELFEVSTDYLLGREDFWG